MGNYFRPGIDEVEFNEYEPIGGKRVLLIGDRELDNFQAIRDHANRHSEIQPAGLIVPGAELDEDILSAVHYYQDMDVNGIAQAFEEESGATGFHFTSPKGADLIYEHATYDKKQLGDEKYREEYCNRLVRLAQSANPDLLFLSNFKVILHKVFVQAFEGKIINVHPSVLPLIKGFRPEHRADHGEEPQASGYTIHFVDTDLDGGPTLFQQHVPLAPKNLEKEAALKEDERKEYEKDREETHRRKFIHAQAKWSAEVLALVAGDTPRKIVSGEEAFAAEGRPGFEQTEEYQRLLQKEYEEWQKKNADSGVTFEDWKKTQKPYSRVLFDKGNGWQTAEAILGAPQESNERDPDILTRYKFFIPGESISAQKRWMRVMEIADNIRIRRGMDGGLKTGYMTHMHKNGPFSSAYIELPYSEKAEFVRLIAEEMPDVILKIQTKTTRVLAPRKKFQHELEVEAEKNREELENFYKFISEEMPEGLLAGSFPVVINKTKFDVVIFGLVDENVELGLLIEGGKYFRKTLSIESSGYVEESYMGVVIPKTDLTDHEPDFTELSDEQIALTISREFAKLNLNTDKPK